MSSSWYARSEIDKVIRYIERCETLPTDVSPVDHLIRVCEEAVQLAAIHQFNKIKELEAALAAARQRIAELEGVCKQALTYITPDVEDEEEGREGRALRLNDLIAAALDRSVGGETKEARHDAT